MTNDNQEQFPQPPISLLPKWEQFIIEYLTNGGNGTAAAMKVFNCKSRESAQVLGSKYLKKSAPFVRAYLEQKGFTYSRFIEIAIEKMKESKKTAWWDRLMMMGGYHNFITE